MATLKLRIITPKQIVHEQEIKSITASAAGGEVTILPRHMYLFSLLKEGVVTIRHDGEETYFSIGGGYLETNGKEVNLLVSRAFGQHEIDEKEVERARTDAERLVQTAKTDEERHAAMLALRRSIIDLKVLGKMKRRKTI